MISTYLQKPLRVYQVLGFDEQCLDVSRAVL